MADEKQNSVWSFAEVSTEAVRKSLAEINTDEMAPDETVEIEIPLFREGNFEHPYYGDLEFNKDYLDTLKTNFERRVVPRAIALDEDHRRYTGRAIGWLEHDGDPKLDIRMTEVPTPGADEPRKMNVLYGRLKLNRHGAKLVKENVYRYFSLEIRNNYTTREKVPTSEGDDTMLVEHGPTIVGGGVTNNPFIPGLGEYAFSEGHTLDEYDEEHNIEVNTVSDEELGYQFGVYGYKLNEKETKVTQPEPEEPVADEEDTVQYSGEDTMKELLKKLAGLESAQEKVDFLSSQTHQYSDDPATLEAIAGLKSTYENQLETEAKFAEAARKAATLQEERDGLRKRNAELATEAQQAREGAYIDRVNLFCQEKAAEGHFPAVINEAKAVLLASPVASRDAEYRFSEDEAEEATNLMGVLNRVFAALPEEARMDFSDNIDANPESKTGEADDGDDEVVPEGSASFADGANDDDDDAIPANVQKYADNFGILPDKELWGDIDEEGRGFKEARN